MNLLMRSSLIYFREHHLFSVTRRIFIVSFCVVTISNDKPSSSESGSKSWILLTVTGSIASVCCDFCDESMVGTGSPFLNGLVFVSFFFLSIFRLFYFSLESDALFADEFSESVHWYSSERYESPNNYSLPSPFKSTSCHNRFKYAWLSLNVNLKILK